MKRRNQSNYQTWIKLQRKIKSIAKRLEETTCEFTKNRLFKKLQLLIKRLLNFNRKWRLGIATATMLLWLGSNNINAQNVFDHTNLNGTNGFEITNSVSNGILGYDIANAGDFNGDGIDDMIISSCDNEPSTSGGVFVIFGSGNALPSEFDLANLNGFNGFRLSEDDNGDFTGISVSAAGDFNKDGFDDLIIGETIHNYQSGRVYIVFGNNQNHAEINLNTLDGTNGFQVNADSNLGPQSKPFQELGSSVAGIGDINNDGYDDIAFTSSIEIESAKLNILYGSDAAFAGINSVDFLAQSNQMSVLESNMSPSEYKLGGSTSTDAIAHGDINGDNIDDLVIGSGRENGSNGAVYTLFGSDVQLADTIDLDILDGTDGFELVGYDFYSYMGASVEVGDINGDGFDDIVAGGYAYYHNARTTVLFGKGTGFTAKVQISDFDGTDGFEIEYLNLIHDESEVSVDVCDINNDGLDDMLIGVDEISINEVNRSGQIHVVYGNQDVWPAKFDINNLTDSEGFIINGTLPNEKLGANIASIGDLNNDGLGDFAFASSQGDKAFVVFGANEMFPVEQVGFEGLDSNKVFTAHLEAPFRNDNVHTGDFNGDGKDDLVIGNWGQDKILFGTESPDSKTIDIGNLNGIDGFTFSADYMTYGIDLLDINGDGFDDLALGNPYTYFYGGPKGGQTYILFGNNNAQNSLLNAADVNANERLIVHSETDFLFAGYNVFKGGDINGDGIDDLFTSSDFDGRYGTVVFGDNTPADSIKIEDLTSDLGFTVQTAGVFFNSGDFNNDNKDDFVLKHIDDSPVIFGLEEGITDIINTDTDLDGTLGFNIKTWNSDEWTENVDGILDFNNDGYDDILFHDADKDTIAIVFGQATPSPAELDIIANPGDLNGTNGMYIAGLPGGETINSVTHLDFNNDSSDDVIFSLSPSNEVYLIYGNNIGDLSIDISTLTASQGFRVNGFGPDAISVEKGGDLSTDGISDLIILEQNIAGTSSSWIAHITYGREVLGSNNYSIDGLQSGKGYDLMLTNEFNNVSRFSTLDFNGDTFDDVVFITDETTWADYKFILSDLCSDPIVTDENVSLCSGEDYTYPDGVLETNIMANTNHESILFSVNGCDSVVTTNITVNEVYAATEEVSVCSGNNHTYPDGTTDNNITVNTNHISNLVSQVTGCDSIITSNITVNEVYATTEEVSVCSGDNHTYPDGTLETNITTNKSYISNLVSQITGCDSTITTNITINEISAISEDVNVCMGDDYIYPDGTTENNITANTNHVSSLVSQVTGCDSTITTNIIANDIFNDSEEVELCSGESYTYPDGTTENNITANTSHESLISVLNSCDSLIITNITINENYNLVENGNVCTGGSYTYPDGIVETNITSNTSHVSNLFSYITGCDSVITTNISVNEVYNITEYSNVCSGDNYTYPDGITENNITENTSYVSNIVSQITGCDSTITTNITVNENYNQTDNVEVCSGNDYTYPDGTIVNNIISTTNHISNLVSQLTGCDSIITTNISVINVNTNVTVSGNTITAENTVADAYQWIDCNLNLPVNSETNYTFTGTETGDYAVKIEENNCIDTSLCNSITITGIEDAENMVQAIWPNPTTGRINIRLTENNAPTEISIYDVTGKLILRKEVTLNETEFTTEILGEGGIYFVQIKSDVKISTLKIVKE